MCFIYGSFGLGVSNLELVRNRGKDGAGFISDISKGFSKKPENLKLKFKDWVLVHYLHSVVGNQKQPFKGKGIFLTNCEIYNWKDLAKKHKLKVKNDAHLFFQLIEKKGLSCLQELDGVYSFAYFLNDKIYLGRDIIGERPLFYKKNKGFQFASENKVISGIELNPRQILSYDLKTGKLEFQDREFFRKTKNIENRGIAKDMIEKVLEKSVEKRIPSVKFGVLVSGGIDSSLLAFFSHSKNNYFVHAEEKAKDIPSIEFLEKNGIKIKRVPVSRSEIEEAIPIVVRTIESADPVKVSVGVVNYLACQRAKKDKIKVLFSGLGADELFGGYQRFSLKNTDKESISYLLRLYENDLYRDDTISMLNNIEIRLPYLDYTLIQSALNLDSSLLLDSSERKIVLRDIFQEKFGIRGALKKSAQYGSGVMPVLKKIASEKKQNLGKYLEQFLSNKRKLAVLMSSGKDSMLSMQIMRSRNYSVPLAISIIPENPDSYMYQKPSEELLEMQVKSLGIELILEKTKGEKEKELSALEKAMKKAKKKGIEGVITGATYSNYQRERIEKTAQKAGLQVYSPLWQINQFALLKSLVREGFKAKIAKIAAYPLTEKHLGTDIDEKLIEEFRKICEKTPGFNPAGEGGEYESIVLDCPMFSFPLEIQTEMKMLTENSGYLEIKKAFPKS